MIITESTVFVISTVQSAVVASIVAKNSIIHNLVIVSYKDYTSINSKRMLINILKYTNIKHLYELDLWLYQVRYNRNQFKKMCYEVMENKKYISEFNKKNFNGELFSGKYEFICEEFSPLTTLTYSAKLKYRIIDHNVLSAIERVVGRGGEISLYSLCKWIKEKIFWRYSLPYMACGYALMKVEGDTYNFIDYRNFEYQYDYNIKFYEIENKNSILLIDHPYMYNDIPEFYDDLKKVDYVEMYSYFARKYLTKSENIILKLHPFVSEKLDAEQLCDYINNIKNRLNKEGYVNCYMLEELITPGDFCVEVYFDILKPSKVIGTYSSVFCVGSSLENCDIEFIVDCHNIGVLRRKILSAPDVVRKNIKFNL